MVRVGGKMVKGLVWRVGLPTFVTAVTTSGIAVAITYATAWRNNLWAWVAVGVLTLVSAGVAVWLYHQQEDPDTPDVSSTANMSGSAEVTVGRGAKVRKLVQADALRNAKVDLGPESDTDTIRVTAGLYTPREYPGTANGPEQQSDVEREPIVLSDEIGQDVK
jgi:hypothetical protein